MVSGMKTISIVVPVYCEQDVLPESYRRIKAVGEGLGEYDYEIIFVNDGSGDNTLGLLREMAAKDERLKVVSFSRNFGHQIAITAGMDRARGDAVVIIDADLQDPPELIPKMIELWQAGAQVVHGRRERRKGESFFKVATASLFYRLLDRLTEIKIPLDTGDFKLIDRKVIDVLKTIKERHRFVRGLVAWTGYEQTELCYQREERFAGETKYPLRRMVSFAVDGLTAFSIKPLKIATKLGLVSVVVGLILTIYVLVSKIMYPETTQAGWASLLIAMIFFGGVQLLTLGVIGEYIGRIYDETRDRPLYVVAEEINTEGQESKG